MARIVWCPRYLAEDFKNTKIFHHTSWNHCHLAAKAYVPQLQFVLRYFIVSCGNVWALAQCIPQNVVPRNNLVVTKTIIKDKHSGIYPLILHSGEFFFFFGPAILRNTEFLKSIPELNIPQVL